jgi:hypothetical protein
MASDRSRERFGVGRPTSALISLTACSSRTRVKDKRLDGQTLRARVISRFGSIDRHAAPDGTRLLSDFRIYKTERRSVWRKGWNANVVNETLFLAG